MKNKYSILLGVSVANVIWFVISFFKLLAGEETNGPVFSVLAGIVLAIITIVQIVKQYKKYKETQSLMPFFIACFKKENGKQMFYLILSLIFNALPLVLIVGFLMLGAANGNSSNNNSNQRSNTGKSQANGNNVRSNNLSSQTKNNVSANVNDNKPDKYSNEEINKNAMRADNNIKLVSDPTHKVIQEFSKNNAGLSDEEKYEKFRKTHSGINVDMETFRAHSQIDSMSNEELRKISSRSDNKIGFIPDSLDGRIKEFSKNNAGLSDEEKYEKYKATHAGLPVDKETFIAHSHFGSLSNEELTKISSRGDNNIKPVSGSIHNRILDFKKKNAGLSVEEQYEKFKKNNIGISVNMETFRAHK